MFVFRNGDTSIERSSPLSVILSLFILLIYHDNSLVTIPLFVSAHSLSLKVLFITLYLVTLFRNNSTVWHPSDLPLFLGRCLDKSLFVRFHFLVGHISGLQLYHDHTRSFHFPGQTSLVSLTSLSSFSFSLSYQTRGLSCPWTPGGLPESKNEPNTTQNCSSEVNDTILISRLPSPSPTVSLILQ